MLKSFATYSYSLFTIVASLVLFFIVGTFIQYSVRKKIEYSNIFSIFLSLVLGQFIITTLYAIYKTNFYTILIFNIPLLGLFIYKLKDLDKLINEKFFNQKDYKKLLFLIISFVPVLLLIYHFKFYNYSISQYFINDIDLTYYAKSSYFINLNGLENVVLDYTSKPTSSHIYHYYDLWQNAFLSEIFSYNYFHTLVFITFLTNNVIIFIGILAILELIAKFSNLNIKLNFLNVFFIFLIFFSTGTFIRLFKEVFSKFLPEILMIKIHYSSYNLLNYPKLFPIYILFMLASILLLNKNYLHALMLSLLSIITSPQVLPTVIASLCFILVIDYLIIKKFKNHVYTLSFLLTFCALYFLFYKITGNNNDINKNFFLTTISVDIKTLKIIIVTFLYLFLGVIISYLPYFFLFKKNCIILNNLTFFLVIFLFFSLLIHSVFHFLQNSFQLFSILAPPIIHIVIYYLLLLNLFSDNNCKKIYLILLVFISVYKYFYNVYSLNGLIEYASLNKEKIDNQSLLSIKNKINGRNHLGAFMLSKDYYKNNLFNFKNTFVYLPGNYLVNFDVRYHPICLSVFDIQYDTTSVKYTNEKEIVKQASFYKFVENQKQNNQFISIEQSQIDFIKKYNIQWLITDNKVKLDDKIKEFVIEKLEVKNLNETYYFLKY